MFGAAVFQCKAESKPPNRSHAMRRSVVRGFKLRAQGARMPARGQAGRSSRQADRAMGPFDCDVLAKPAVLIGRVGAR